MRPEALAEARSWLEKANRDLRAADADLAAKPPLLDDVAFHAQQAVEKALKGFLASRDMAFRKTHDLDELARACEAIEPSLAPLLGPARDLTPYAWVFRYPGEAQEPTPTEAREALLIARSVVARVGALLSEKLG